MRETKCYFITWTTNGTWLPGKTQRGQASLIDTGTVSGKIGSLIATLNAQCTHVAVSEFDSPSQAQSKRPAPFDLRCPCLHNLVARGSIRTSVRPWEISSIFGLKIPFCAIVVNSKQFDPQIFDFSGGTHRILQNGKRISYGLDRPAFRWE